MLADAGGWIGILTGALALILGLAAAVALVRASLVKSTVDELRNDRDDLEKRVARLESEREDLKSKLAEKDQKVERLQADLEQERRDRIALARVVAGTDMLVKIEQLIRDHDGRVDEVKTALEKHDKNVTLHHRATRELFKRLAQSMSAELKRVLPRARSGEREL